MAHKYSFNSRNLSAQEAVLDLLHAHGSHTLLHAAFLTSSVNLSEETFISSLRRLVDFQPMLNMRISSEYKARTVKKKTSTKIIKRFQEIDVIDIDFHIRKETSRDAWIDIAEQELSVPFKSDSGPLWKVVFVEFTHPFHASHLSTRTDSRFMGWTGSLTSQMTYVGDSYQGVLLFKIHNAIADGVSMYDLIHRQLIPMMNDFLTGNTLPKYSTPLHVLPSATDSFPKTTLSKKQIKAMNLKRAAILKPPGVDSEMALPQPALCVLGDAGNPKESPRCRLWCYKFPKTLTPSLIMSCKYNRVSVEDALVASAAIALTLCAQQMNVVFHGENVVCTLSKDLRHFHQRQSDVEPLGVWTGNDVIEIKKARCESCLSAESFWNLVRQLPLYNLHPDAPWDGLVACREILNLAEKQNNVRSAAEICKAHLEISVHLQDQDKNHKNMQFISMGHHTESEPVKWVKSSGHFAMESVSDISNVPVKMCAVIDQERTFCAVTYNERWISEDFIKRFITVQANILTTAVSSTTTGTTRSRNKLPAVVRAESLKSRP